MPCHRRPLLSFLSYSLMSYFMEDINSDLHVVPPRAKHRYKWERLKNWDETPTLIFFLVNLFYFALKNTMIFLFYFKLKHSNVNSLSRCLFHLIHLICLFRSNFYRWFAWIRQYPLRFSFVLFNFSFCLSFYSCSPLVISYTVFDDE